MADWLVFTDLDGTLLDHETYSHAAATPMLARLDEQGIPVVLASSKTAAEIVPLRDRLGLSDVPAICENGAGLVPGGVAGVVRTGHYTALRKALDGVKPELRRWFTGFGDMTETGVARITGLRLSEARRARNRQFSEPGVWTGSKAGRAEFEAELARQGVSARMGGRFLTVSFGTTKAGRMAEIVRQYGAPRTIALGDAPNDIEMLEEADFGVIVANPHRHPLPVLKGEADGRIIRTERPGPEGWSHAVEHILCEEGALT